MQPPAPVGYFDEVSPGENFERQKRFTPYTAMYNVTGQPAVNLPLYWTGAGLPPPVILERPKRLRDGGLWFGPDLLVLRDALGNRIQFGGETTQYPHVNALK